MRRFLVSVVLVFALAGPRHAGAISIDPRLWQQLAESADFIGVVECDVAGLVVARYRVVEVWKGDVAVGRSIALRNGTIPMMFSPRLPLALVGERFVVAAQRSRPAPPASAALGSPEAHPVLGRTIPSDFDLPYYQGAVRLAGASPSYHPLGTQQNSLAAVREDFMHFVALDADARATLVLRAVVEKYLVRREAMNAQAPGLGPALLQAPTHAAAAEVLFSAWNQGNADVRALVEFLVPHLAEATRRLLMTRAAQVPAPTPRTYTVQKGDTLGRIALQLFGSTQRWPALLEANRDQIQSEYEIQPGMVLRIHTQQELITALQRADAFAPESSPAPVPRPPSTSELDATRERLRATPVNDAASWEPARLLLVHDPAGVVDWLCNWTNPDASRARLDRGYPLGSWVAMHARGDRIRHLTTLLGARDAWVRVAAAVHLAFEDEAQGLVALRELATLPDEPGVWAALSLARRGDRAALGRAITVLASDARERPLRFTLQDRVLELLSNTAVAQGVSMPDLPRNDAGVFVAGPAAGTQARAFLDAHPEMQPVDPWFAALREQKRD